MVLTVMARQMTEGAQGDIPKTISAALLPEGQIRTMMTAAPRLEADVIAMMITTMTGLLEVAEATIQVLNTARILSLL